MQEPESQSQDIPRVDDLRATSPGVEDFLANNMRPQQAAPPEEPSIGALGHCPPASASTGAYVKPENLHAWHAVEQLSDIHVLLQAANKALDDALSRQCNPLPKQPQRPLSAPSPASSIARQYSSKCAQQSHRAELHSARTTVGPCAAVSPSSARYMQQPHATQDAYRPATWLAYPYPVPQASCTPQHHAGLCCSSSARCPLECAHDRRMCRQSKQLKRGTMRRPRCLSAEACDSQWGRPPGPLPCNSIVPTSFALCATKAALVRPPSCLHAGSSQQWEGHMPVKLACAGHWQSVSRLHGSHAPSYICWPCKPQDCTGCVVRAPRMLTVDPLSVHAARSRMRRRAAEAIDSLRAMGTTL
jgi:hypothetical protein